MTQTAETFLANREVCLKRRRDAGDRGVPSPAGIVCQRAGAPRRIDRTTSTDTIQRQNAPMLIHDWSRVDPGVFHDFHLIWVARLRNLLNDEVLPRPFYALAEPVVGEAEPDLITEGVVAVAQWPVVVQEISPDPYARRARQIVIKDAWRGDSVVAVIEFVSWGNETSQTRAEQFVRKGASILERRIHLVIVDVHRPTKIVPLGFHAKIWDELGHEAPEIPPDRPLSVVSYQVLESGSVRARLASLKLEDHLPVMPVFLSPHDFVILPLDDTYTECFKSVPWKFREVLEKQPIS